MAVMIIVFFISFLFLQRSDQMQTNINLLFENKIGCVANLFGFNGGEREILKTASWISFNDLMLSQKQDLNDNESHIAQWLLIIQIGKHVQEMLNINARYASNDLWREFEEIANGQQKGNTTMNLINYLVERCR